MKKEEPSKSTALAEILQGSHDSGDLSSACIKQTYPKTKNVDSPRDIRHYLLTSDDADDKATISTYDPSLQEDDSDTEEEGEAKQERNVHSRKDQLATLEQDVEHLRTKLKGQRATKGILEQALARPSSVLLPADGHHISQHTQKLIRDIALLELEVAHLEQHLLSMYRKAFEVRVKDQSCVSKVLNEEARAAPQPHCEKTDSVKKKLYTKSGSLLSKKPMATSVGNRSFNDTKLTRAVSGVLSSSRVKPMSSYSQPIVISKRDLKSSPSPVTCELWREVISAESNTSSTVNDDSFRGEAGENPNKLSEELVRCMAAIYCKLADPPISYPNSSISPSPSSSSSASTASSKEFSSDGWSPHTSHTPSPLSRKSKADGSSSYSSMVVVHWISMDNDRLQYAEKMLQTFKYLVRGLEGLNPGSLNHEEKLAFWLNIHNALMMHAYLAYGIPQNHIKRVSLLHKASYKIGAHSINAHTIEHNLLGCRSHRPAQWIQSLLSPVSKLRGASRQSYALDKTEPLVYFALSCGGRSDPAVRVYTPKNVYHELDAAKRDFLQANVTIRDDTRVLLPKVLESFAKELSMSSLSLLEWICLNVHDYRRKELRMCMNLKPYKCIEWVPYNFNFRYLFVRDLARWFPHSS